jgi:glycosyltransferase involved in cell wall biosynthesis
MRIAEIAPPWLAVPPAGYGGVEWVISLLADGLADRGHEVTLFATGDSATRARLEFTFDRAPGSAAINDIWHDTVHTAFATRDLSRFDVLHVHPTWSALVAGATSGVPMVHTLHGAFHPHMRRIYEQIATRAWFVAISEAQRAMMPELNYAGVVYNGIDLDRYPIERRKDDFLLFLGRTAPDKGMARAVEAARAAGMRLVAAVKTSSESERREWADHIEPLLGDDVEVRGEIDVEEKALLLSRARALLFPIDWPEPFGLVMIEAMACGTPVIATRHGAVPEVIEDGRSGIIVDDYRVMPTALEDADRLDPFELRRYVEERFSPERMVADYVLAYEAAAERTGA